MTSPSPVCASKTIEAVLVVAAWLAPGGPETLNVPLRPTEQTSRLPG
jgi:hypothetical protein